MSVQLMSTDLIVTLDEIDQLIEMRTDQYPAKVEEKTVKDQREIELSIALLEMLLPR